MTINTQHNSQARNAHDHITDKVTRRLHRKRIKSLLVGGLLSVGRLLVGGLVLGGLLLGGLLLGGLACFRSAGCSGQADGLGRLVSGLLSISGLLVSRLVRGLAVDRLPVGGLLVRPTGSAWRAAAVGSAGWLSLEPVACRQAVACRRAVAGRRSIVGRRAADQRATGRTIVPNCRSKKSPSHHRGGASW